MMKKINKYILEKFKISKDIKNEIPLEKGDAVLRVLIIINTDNNNKVYQSEILLGGDEAGEEKVLYFDKIKDERIYIFYYKENIEDDDSYPIDDEVETKLFVNKNGFYQTETIVNNKGGNNDHYWYSIYLDKYNGIDFIKNIWNKAKDNKISLDSLQKYFDIDKNKIVADNFDGYFELDSNSEDNVDEILYDLKNEES